MKRLAFQSVAIVLATAVNLWAGEERLNPYRPGAPGAWSTAVRSKSAAQWYIESLDPIVGLTDEQKKAITAVIESRDKTMQEFQGKHAEKLAAASKALGEAYQRSDTEAIAKAQNAYQELYAPFHQAMKDSQRKLDEILTPQQKEKQADHQMAAWIKAMTDPIELSAEQKQKAKAAFREMQKTAGDATAGGNPSVNNIRGGFAPQEAILKILTAQQRVALNKHRLGSYVKAMFARVNLTDEQNKKVEALLDKICQDPKLSADWKTYQSVSQKVEELLTAEQKETLKRPAIFRGPWVGGIRGAGGGFFAPGSPQAMPGQVGQYWIGLFVEPVAAEQRKKLEVPDDRGLAVQAVSPESPAAKAGIKAQDVILTAGDRAMKSVPDLVRAVEQAKDKDLVLEIIRDGKKQKITVKPAKRPMEGVAVFQIEGSAIENPPAGAKVRHLPGGGVQVIIGEANEGPAGKAATGELEIVRQELEKTLASARGNMGERIKRQHELAEKAWQAYQKMKSLGEDKKTQAHELWEQIESLEGQLRQTFEPVVAGLRPAPGISVNGGVLNLVVPGVPANPGWIQVVPQNPLLPGEWLAGQALPGQPVPGAAVIRSERGQNAALEELRAQVERLRRDVEELKAQAKKQGKSPPCGK